jgi:poly(3-hydroxybutyrate) depolymerase
MRAFPIRFAARITLVGAVAAGACSTSGSGSPSGMGGVAGTSSGAAGSGVGTGGSVSATGGTGGSPSGGGGAGAGTSGGGGAAGATNQGTAGVSGTGGAVGGAGAGVAGTGGSGVAGTGASGAAGAPAPRPTGRSAGCGQAPPTTDKSTGFTVHNLAVPACAGAVTSKCVAPAFAPGGAAAQSNGAYDFLHRNYAVQLPTGYDVTKAYPVIIGGGGCGGGPTESGGGFSAGQGPADAIRIGMSYVKMCFADGGNSCAGTPTNQPLCVNTPEVPYFYAVLADVESKYCIEKSKVFVGGYSSGGWETFTLGCAAADVVRGIVTDNGGLRNHRPACTNPIAALMVAGEIDHDNPIGPLVMDMAYAPASMTAADVNTAITSLDSNGTAPARDAILARNGCVGTDTGVYDAAYPQCKKYTGCPADSPVVWCSIPGAGHGNNTYQGVNYYPGGVAGNSLMWNFLTKLP